MKDRIQDPTSCIQKRRKRRDPPDEKSTSSHNKGGMSSADFNYLSIPSLFGGRPVSSRFESSMNDCMLQSGAYVSYVAEAMDPTPRLDPEGTLGEPNKATMPADEEMDDVDENTVTDKSDAAFIQAYMRRIETGETIRKRPPERFESMSLNDEGMFAKRALSISKEKEEQAHRGGGPLACTPMSASKTPKTTNRLLSTNRLCFGDDPGSPLSTTTGGGSIRPSDSDSIEAPQQLDCKIKDDQFPTSPAMRSSRRMQSPRRQRSRSKSRAVRARPPTSKRKTKKSTPSINFTSTLESGSLKSVGSPRQEEETGEHIEVIFVEEQFRNKGLFQYGDEEGAVFSAPHEQQQQPQTGSPLQNRPKTGEHNDLEMTPSHLRSLRKKCILDMTKGTTTEEESTIRMDERDSMAHRRVVSPQQSRQPASPLIAHAEENQMDDTDSSNSAFVSKESKIPLEYSRSETTEQQGQQALHSRVSAGDDASKIRERSIPENKELETSHSMPSDERGPRGRDSSNPLGPKKTFSFTLTSGTDEPLQAPSGKSFFDASEATNASILDSSKSRDRTIKQNPSFSLHTSNEANRSNIGKSSGEATSTSNEFVANGLHSFHDLARVLEVHTPLAGNLKSDMLELEVSRSNEMPESDFAKEQVSRDMFSIKSDSRSKTSRNDPKTAARVSSLMALVDCASPVSTKDPPNKSRLGRVTQGFATSQESISRTDIEFDQTNLSTSEKKSTAFFVPFDPKEARTEQERHASTAGVSPKEYPSFFVPLDPRDSTSKQGRSDEFHVRKKLSPEKLGQFLPRNSAVDAEGQHGAGSASAVLSPRNQSASESRGPAIASLVEKHDMLQSMYKKTSKASDWRENSILADSTGDERLSTNGSRNPLNIDVPGVRSRGSVKGIVSESEIELADSRGAVCESVPSSIQTERTEQGSLVIETAKSGWATCSSIPSSIPSEKTIQETMQEECCNKSTADSPGEEYFTCHDRDESSERPTSKESDGSAAEGMQSHQRQKSVRLGVDCPADISKREKAVSPLTVEKVISPKESCCEVESHGGPPQVIEVNQEEGACSEIKSDPLSMLPLHPFESSQSQLDSIPSKIEDRPCASGWDVSTIAPRSYISGHDRTGSKVIDAGNRSFTENYSVPREITTDIFSVSVGTIQSCATSSSKRDKDRIGKYSRGGTFSRTTYVQQTHSSVSVTSRKGQKASDAQSSERDDKSQGNSNPKNVNSPDGNSNDRIAYLRSALDSERSRIMDQVSALIPAQNGCDWERTIKSVFNDSGVVLFQPTINLYGGGHPHRLEPEGSTRNSSSMGPEIINLTEAQEEREMAERETAANRSGCLQGAKSKDSTKTKMDPEAMSAIEYQQSLSQKEEQNTSEQSSSEFSPEQKVNVVTVTSPVTSSDEACDDTVAPQNISHSDTTQHTNQFAADKATSSRTTGPNLASYFAQKLPRVDVRETPGSFVSHQIIDCTSDVYDLPDIFPEEDWTGKRNLEDEWAGLSQESSRQQVTEHVSRLASVEELENHADLDDDQQHRQHVDGHGKHQKGGNSAPLPVSVGGYVSEDTGFLPDNPVDSSDSQRVQPIQLKRGMVDWRELGDRVRQACPPCDGDWRELERRVRQSCPPCDKSDVADKMGDLCLKAGYGISDALRRAVPKRGAPYMGRRKSVIRDDDDDGMEEELRDLERSEQLLRRELELVHQQAEIRRQRLRIAQDNDTSTPVDLFTDCLWPSNTQAPVSNRLIGHRLVANSFSTSQKSVDDDLTENYFSPTEDCSTATFLSPTLSMEQSQEFWRKQELVPVKEEDKNQGSKSNSAEELEVIFVEDSFMSTDSFSFGEVTKKSVRESSTKTRKLNKTSDDLSYLKKSQSHSNGLEPVGEVCTGHPKPGFSGTKSDPVEIISLLSLDQPSTDQPGDPGMPILVGSQEASFLEIATSSSSRDKCDPPGSSLDLEAPGVRAHTTKPKVARESNRRATNLQTLSEEPESTAADLQQVEPLESIEVVVLENGRLPTGVQAETKPIATPDRVDNKSIERHDCPTDGLLPKKKTDSVSTDDEFSDADSDPRLEHGHSQVITHDRDHRSRPSVTFLLPGRDDSSANVSSSRGAGKAMDIIDLKDFDDSVLEHQSASSSQRQTQNHSNSSTSMNSIEDEFRTQASCRAEIADTTGSEAEPNKPSRSGTMGSSAIRSRATNSVSSGVASGLSQYSYRESEKQHSLKRLETIDRIGERNDVVFLGSLPELPPVVEPYSASYGASTFDDTRDSDTCESLSSRVKKLIAKAKSNRREDGHDTFESRSTLTIKIPESLSLSEDEKPTLQPNPKREINKNFDQEVERAIEDNIAPEFSTATNRIPARVMLARLASHDQASLSTITLPQLQESRSRRPNNKLSEEKGKRRNGKLPDILTIAKPLGGESILDKDGMEIHFSRADDESSVTMDFPESLNPAFRRARELSAERSPSPSRIQRLIATGKRFVSAKRFSPRNSNTVNEEPRQTVAGLETALGDTWSLEAENTRRSRDTASESLDFNYSLSPTDSVVQEPQKQSVASSTSSKKLSATSPQDKKGSTLVSRRERVRKLHRSVFSRGRSPQSVASDPPKKVAQNDSVHEESAPARSQQSTPSFEDQFAAMRQRVQEMRHLSGPIQEPYSDIFRGSPHTVPPQMSPKHQLRPPRPPRGDL